MTEKFSHRNFDRVVGFGVEIEHHERNIREYIDRLIDVKGGKWIEGYEAEKTNQEKEIIDFVCNSADQILKEYGRVHPPTVSINNIHVLKPNGTEEFTEGRLHVGGHAAKQGSILIDRQESMTQFALVLFHELMHLKAYKALQLTLSSENRDIEVYRQGFTVTSRDGKTDYFKSLEEAIVGFLTLKFYNEVLKNNQLFENDSTETEDVKVHISRMDELEALNMLVDELWQRNQNEFSSRREIFELFVDAHINGNLLKVGRLIESTFGKGSFRKLGV